MRPLVSRTAIVAAMLILAAAVAVSAPLGHSLVAQSTALQPIGKARQPLHTMPIASPTAAPAAQLPAATVPAQAPATRPKSAARPHVAMGTGQWGLINQDRAAAGLPTL